MCARGVGAEVSECSQPCGSSLHADPGAVCAAWVGIPREHAHWAGGAGGGGSESPGSSWCRRSGLESRAANRRATSERPSSAPLIIPTPLLERLLAGAGALAMLL